MIMYSFEYCQDLINKELENIDLKGSPFNLYEPIRYILSVGGKRIRPSLTLMGCNLFSDNINDAIKPAIAVEIFHNFTLMHDDIMDKADTRRNHATIHKKWNENIAILSGDAMLIKSYEYISACQDNIIKKILSLFNKTALKICEGQQYDMNFESKNDVSIEEYLRMIELKTAVLLATSSKIGALTGQASADDAELLYEFGRYTGIAFQLQDDLLDVYARPEVFGKAVGADIVANKKTYLLVSALNCKDKNIISELISWIEKKEFDKEKKIKKITEIFNRLGLKDTTKAKISDYLNKGFNSLEKISVSDNRKTNLRELVQRMISRVK